MRSAAQEEASGLDRRVAFAPPAPEQKDESPLSKEEIAAFHEHLQHLREWLVGSLRQLEAKSVPQSDGRAVSAESVEAAWQNTINQRAIADRRLLLHEVTQAFERIRANTYGRCVEDNAPIPRSLLEQVPWARFCTVCANRHA